MAPLNAWLRPGQRDGRQSPWGLHLEQLFQTVSFSSGSGPTGATAAAAWQSWFWPSLYLTTGYQPQFDLDADPETLKFLAFTKELPKLPPN